ncbi:MAG: hypothetical protein BYD32DRAFT_110100 [Podila humilis]|nr:MAG: hypothetical protein BYD32DRAFT_110100 [Podila humilis]
MTNPCHAVASVSFQRSWRDDLIIIRISVVSLRYFAIFSSSVVASPIHYPRVRQTTVCRFYDDHFIHLNGPGMVSTCINIIEPQTDLVWRSL